MTLRDLLPRVEQAIRERGRHAAPWAWVALLFWATGWGVSAAAIITLQVLGSWWALALVPVLLLHTIVLALAFMHDGSHKSMGHPRGWLNWFAAHVLSLLGVSKALWRIKHVVRHHSHTNVPGEDPDIEAGIFFRFHPGQARKPWHRFQHLYFPFLYSLHSLKWFWFNDYAELATNRFELDDRAWRHLLVEVILTRVWHVSLWLVLPLVLGAPVALVLVTYVLTWGLLGLNLALVFQAAHVGPIQTFPQETSDHQTMVEHQLATTADFAPNNPLLRHLLGGLNFQVEHHLFPHIHHRHLHIVHEELKALAKEHGLTVHVYPSFTAAVVAHIRHLRQLGKPDGEATAAPVLATAT